MTYIQKTIVTAFFIALPSLASAECYADYKAKQTSGDLRLHYGIVELPDAICGDKNAMNAQIQGRIGGDGWKLLRVMSTFGADQLNNKQADAGEYFLRY
tara:strand:- start:29765 stop:30061 length:297 start_codon:yes stop_codon:yes gene_type:complete